MVDLTEFLLNAGNNPNRTYSQNKWNDFVQTLQAALDEASAEPVYNIDPPSISGTPVPDETLTADDGRWLGGTTTAYQWERNGAPIAGATGATYEVQLADDGANVGVAVTVSNDNRSLTLDSPTLLIEKYLGYEYVMAFNDNKFWREGTSYTSGTAFRVNHIYAPNKATIWPPVGAAVARTGVANPLDGAASFRLTEDATTGLHAGSTSGTPPVAGATATMSVYLKAGTATVGGLLGNSNIMPALSAAVLVDLSNGTFVNNPVGITAKSIESVGDGWYRLKVTFIVGSAPEAGTVYVVAGSGSDYSYAGTAGRYLDFYGLQLEVGAVATPAMVGPVDYEGKAHALSNLPGLNFTRTGEQGAQKSPTYGPEKVIGANGAVAVATPNTSVVYQTAIAGLATNKSYRVRFTVTGWTQGALNLRLGNNTLNNITNLGSGNGIVEVEVMPFNIATGDLTLTAFGTTTLTISNVSVQEITSYGAVEWFSANVPAVNDRGYHAYGALTNIVPDSVAFAAAGWTVFGGAAKTATAQAAPDGSTTAARVNWPAHPASTTALYQFYHTVNTAAATYTISAFVRSATGTPQKFRLKINDGADKASPDFTAGAVWQRFSFTVELNAINGGNIAIANATDGSAADVEFWMPQAILGNYPDGGPLIRTGAATATIGESLLTSALTLESGDMLIWANLRWQASRTPNKRLFRFDDGTDNNRVEGMIEGAILYGYTASAGVGGVLDSIGLPIGSDSSVILKRQGGQWFTGKVANDVVTWGTVPVTLAFPAGLNRFVAGSYGISTGYAANEILKDIFVKRGTYTDAEVLAIVGGSQ